MRNSWIWLLIVIVIVGAAGAGYWYGRQHGQPIANSADKTSAASDAPAVKPVAQVVTEPLRLASITQQTTVYGTVVAQPGDVRIFSVPFESRVVTLLVMPGQKVDTGTALIRVESSPDALMALQEARNAVTAADRDFAQTQQRFDEHLATNADLSLAQQTLQSARLRLQSLRKRGVGTSRLLKASIPGIVSKIDVQEGQIVPAGAPLVELASGNHIEVALEVEPEDVQYLKAGQPVQLRLVSPSHSRSIVGRIRVISQRVDPATRLATVVVSLPPRTHWMLDTFIVGELATAQARGLVVPRDAVLPDPTGGYSLFTVSNDHAVEHPVRLGLQNDRQTQIFAEDLRPGELVVVLGNHELEDGMAVTTSPPAREPAGATPTTEAAR